MCDYSRYWLQIVTSINDNVCDIQRNEYKTKQNMKVAYELLRYEYETLKGYKKNVVFENVTIQIIEYHKGSEYITVTAPATALTN